MQRPLRTGKLLDHEIPGLRHRIKTGQTTTAEEADRFGVGIETVRRAVRGETFRHITEGMEEVVTRPTPLGEEPTEDEIAASARRLKDLLGEPEAQRDAVDDFIKKRSE